MKDFKFHGETAVTDSKREYRGGWSFEGQSMNQNRTKPPVAMVNDGILPGSFGVFALLDVCEAAQKCRVSVQTVRNWYRHGRILRSPYGKRIKLKVVRVNRKILRIRVTDLQYFLTA